MRARSGIKNSVISELFFHGFAEFILTSLNAGSIRS